MMQRFLKMHDHVLGFRGGFISIPKGTISRIILSFSLFLSRNSTYSAMKYYWNIIYHLKDILISGDVFYGHSIQK